jgi:hypothetical protein
LAEFEKIKAAYEEARRALLVNAPPSTGE